MDHFDQVHQIYTMLKNARLPVSKRAMKDKLEVSASTIKNRIAELRDRYDAPIKYSHRANGYYFEDDKYELKGIWFSQNELFALLTLEQQLETLEPGLISEQLKVFKNKIIKLIQQEIPEQQLSRRLRILSIHNKQVNPDCFEVLAKATLLRQRLDITHQRHADQRVSQRIISPQRLVYYKANWYVDAWCHLKRQIRTFAIDAILSASVLKQPATEVPEQQLEQATSPSYGIFAGDRINNARLIFSDPASHWVSREKWHSQQQGCWLDAHHYQLIVPYQHDEELLMDILKYGEWVRVEEPLELQQKIYRKIVAMQKNYQK